MAQLSSHTSWAQHQPFSNLSPAARLRLLPSKTFLSQQPPLWPLLAKSGRWSWFTCRCHFQVWLRSSNVLPQGTSGLPESTPHRWRKQRFLGLSPDLPSHELRGKNCDSAVSHSPHVFPTASGLRMAVLELPTISEDTLVTLMCTTSTSNTNQTLSWSMLHYHSILLQSSMQGCFPFDPLLQTCVETIQFARLSTRGQVYQGHETSSLSCIMD